MEGVHMRGVWFGYRPERPVLAGIDLHVPAGAVLGFLGANGAGKTTAFRLLAGLLRPDAGEIELAGVSVLKDAGEARRRCAYVPEEPLLYPFLSALENLNMFALLWGVPGRVARVRAEVLLREVDLWPLRQQWVRTYSRGMRQKLALCAALLHEPRVLIMDEPFAGLDIAAGLWARKLLRKFAELGGSVVFTSHTPEIIEALADCVVVLHEGQVAYANSQAGLRRDGGAVAVFERVCGGFGKEAPS